MSTSSYHHGRLREALVEEGRKILSSRGPAALTLREVAAAAGVSHTAPYRHFESKSALWAAIAEEGFVRLADRMSRAMVDGREPVRAVQGAGLAYVEFAIGNGSLFSLMFGPELADRSSFPGLKNAADLCFNVLVEGLERCKTSGKLPTGAQIPELALSAWSLVHGLATLLLAGQQKGRVLPGTSVRDLVNGATRTLYEGMR